MNHEPDITDAERELLGHRQADELARDERWLAGEPIDPPVPAGLAERVMAAVSAELARPARPARNWQWLYAAAAVLLFAVLVGLFARTMMPGSGTRSGPQAVNGANSEVVVRAEQAIDQYLRPIDPAEVQLHFEMQRIDQAMDGADNPWDALACAIEDR